MAEHQSARTRCANTGTGNDSTPTITKENVMTTVPRTTTTVTLSAFAENVTIAFGEAPNRDVYAKNEDGTWHAHYRHGEYIGAVITETTLAQRLEGITFDYYLAGEDAVPARLAPEVADHDQIPDVSLVTIDGSEKVDIDISGTFTATEAAAAARRILDAAERLNPSDAQIQMAVNR